MYIIVFSGYTFQHNTLAAKKKLQLSINKNNQVRRNEGEVMGPPQNKNFKKFAFPPVRTKYQVPKIQHQQITGLFVIYVINFTTNLLFYICNYFIY